MEAIGLAAGLTLTTIRVNSGIFSLSILSLNLSFYGESPGLWSTVRGTLRWIHHRKGRIPWVNSPAYHKWDVLEVLFWLSHIRKFTLWYLEGEFGVNFLICHSKNFQFSWSLPKMAIFNLKWKIRKILGIHTIHQGVWVDYQWLSLHSNDSYKNVEVRLIVRKDDSFWNDESSHSHDESSREWNWVFTPPYTFYSSSSFFWTRNSFLNRLEILKTRKI